MLAYKPKFWDSPYLVTKGDIGTWYLKEGAPKELIEELERVKKEIGPSKSDKPTPI
jgi:hypothetical protein